MLIQGKGNHCSKWKKGKLKTNKSLKITRYFMRWTWVLGRPNLTLRKYVFIKTWKVAITAASTYIWKLIKIVGSMPETIQATIPESSHVQWFFIQQKGHLCWQPCSLDNTLNRSSSAGESFKIKEKLCLFVLGVIHISNLPTICIKLMRVGVWA